MELVELASLDLTYTTLEVVDYGAEGRLYGTMVGRLTGQRISGDLQLTNLAPRRVDNVNLPMLRGILSTDDGDVVWVELDGIATLRERDNTRVFTTTFRFRTGAEQYAWLNTVFGVLEGVLDWGTGVARGRAYICEPTVT